MKTTFRILNVNAYTEIAQILAANHKLGGDHFTSEMIGAWADEVQRQLDSGNSPSFEIKSWDSIKGHTQEFTLSDECIDYIDLESDE